MKNDYLIRLTSQFHNTGVLSAVALTLFAVSAAEAQLVPTPLGPYSNLDSGYTASIVAADTGNVYTLGVAFVGNTLVRSADNGTLYVYNNTTSTVHGDTVFNFTTLTVGGAGWVGRGIVGDSTYLYGNGRGNLGSGIYKINVGTDTSTKLVNSVGGSYGIGFLNSHTLVYNDGSQVRKYDLLTNTDSLFYNAAGSADGLSVTPDGHVIIADLSGRLLVLDSSGNLINTFVSAHNPDGTAFGGGSIYKANTDGTLTKVDFSGPNFTGAGTETVIGNGLQYSDLSTVGPDGSFYVSVLGAHYADGYQGSYGTGGALIKIDVQGGGGFGPPSTPDSGATVTLLASGLLGVAALRRKFARA